MFYIVNLIIVTILIILANAFGNKLLKQAWNLEDSVGILFAFRFGWTVPASLIVSTAICFGFVYSTMTGAVAFMIGFPLFIFIAFIIEAEATGEVESFKAYMRSKQC